MNLGQEVKESWKEKQKAVKSYTRMIASGEECERHRKSVTSTSIVSFVM